MTPRSVSFAAIAALIMGHAAMADIFVTATERENKKLVKVDVTPPFTPASCTARTGSPDCIITIFNTPDEPDSLVQDPQGRLIYSEPLANQIRRFDPASNTDVLLSDSTNGVNFPQDMILEPSGNSLLVANFSGNKITRVNLAGPFPNGTVFTTISTPEGMVFDTGGRLFVNAGFGTAGAGIYQLDPVTGAILKQNIGFDPANQPDGLTFDPSTNRLFATSSGIPGPGGGSNSIFSIDPNTLAAVKIGSVPAPDGVINDFHGTLYVASRTGFVYSVSELMPNTVTQLTPVPTIDDLGIVPAQPPTATKTFNPRIVFSGDISQITITITNPNPASTLLNLSFTDTLPPGILVAPSPNATNTCGGTLTAVAGANTISLTGVPSLGAGSSCTVKVDVVDNNPPSSSQNCVVVNSSNGGSSGPACDMITVNPGPPQPLQVIKSFGAASILLGDTTTMTITVNNPNSLIATSLAFTDPLPSGLVVANPVGLVDSCGGSFTPPLAAGATTLVYAGGTIAPKGVCNITLNVTATSATPASSGIPPCPAATSPTTGQKINCVIVSAVVNTQPATGGPGIATLTVNIPTPPMPPAIAKSFAVPSISVFGSTTLTFLVTNPNIIPPPVTLSGINFTDILPVGLVVATPANVIGTCGGGTITAFAGTNVISLSGATLPGGGSCTFSVDVTAVLAGVQVNTTSNISSTNPILVGNTGTATLNVNPPDDSYQINYLPNVKVAGAVDITNAGSLGADPFGPRSGTSGRICANVYVFSPDEQEISCCSCLVTPNALVHVTAADLVGNTATGAAPDSVVVKLLFTVPGATSTTPGTQVGPFTSSVCNAANPFNFTNLAPGGRAWALKFHSPVNPPSSSFSPTETEFLFNPIRLGQLTQNTAGEINMMTNLCQFISGNQSGAGICKSCTLGGIGGLKK